MFQKSLLITVIAVAGLLAAQNPSTTPNDQTQTQQQRSKTNDKTGSMKSGHSGSYGSLNSTDGKFLHTAIEGGHQEVELGRMAAEKASDSAVKQFGQRMVDDHSKANSELESLAQSKGMDSKMMMQSGSGGKWSKSGSGMAGKLSSATGAQFDRMYMSHMVQDHEKDVAHFENASKNASDSEVKALAAKLLPTLKEHLSEAKSIQQKLGGSSGSSNPSSR